MVWIIRFAPILFLVNSLLLGFFSSGYNPQRNSISSLVHVRLGYLQTANFVLCGLLTLGLAYYLKEYSGATINSARLAHIGIIVFGASLVLLGFFPTDKPGQTTAIGQIHGAIFILSVFIQAGLQLAVAFTNFPSAIAIYLVISGLISAFGLLGMAYVPEFRGYIQRVLVGSIILWVTISSFWLRK